LAPASVQTVTVPGPINAAAINGPGPRFRNGFLIANWGNFSENRELRRIIVSFNV
jgi:hypothetical protein